MDITRTTDSRTYGYDYRFFKDGIMHLPNLRSGRIYISINNKILMPIVVDGRGMLGIADPSPFNTADPNYQLLYDKVEFTYLGRDTVINPTAVDFLALTIAVSQKNIRGEVVTYGITKPRETSFAAITNAFNNAPGKAAWKQLIVKNSDGTILRVVGPGRDDHFFDRNYLSGTPYNYVDDVWNYYKTHELMVDCGELRGVLPGLSNYIFLGKVVNNDFVFDNQRGEGTVTIGKPTSNQFFLAAQGSFDAPNNTPKAVIVRNITSAWSVGLFPAEDGAVLSKNYFESKKAEFYTFNPRLSPQAKNGGPWYDLYAAIIHKQSMYIYAFAYDDALGMDGTNSSIDQYPATLVVQDMAQTKIPGVPTWTPITIPVLQPPDIKPPKLPGF